MNEAVTHDLRIRPVEAPHLADLIRIGEETNLSPWTAQCYLDELKNDEAVLLRLIDDDNLTVGFIAGRFVASEAINRTDAEIYNIAVCQENQRNGFGQMLFDAFAAACHTKSATNIWLEVRESNTKAIAFYEKNGFSRVQTRNHFYSNPREHAIVMRRVL